MDGIIAVNREVITQQVAKIEEIVGMLEQSALKTRAFGVQHNTETAGPLAYKLAKVNRTLYSTRTKLMELMQATNEFLTLAGDTIAQADESAL